MKPGQIISLRPGETVEPLYRGVLDQRVHEFLKELGNATDCEPEFRIKLDSDLAEIHLPGWRVDFYPHEFRGRKNLDELATQVAVAIKEGYSNWESRLPRMRLWRMYGE